MLYLITSNTLPVLLFTADSEAEAIASLKKGLIVKESTRMMSNDTFRVRQATIDELDQLVKKGGGEATVYMDGSF